MASIIHLQRRKKRKSMNILKHAFQIADIFDWLADDDCSERDP
jgi:hypothetical protein